MQKETLEFNVLTLFPEMVQAASKHSILNRAIEKKIISINAINPRDFSLDKHKKVDDIVFGGSCGMLLSCQPFLDAFDSIEKKQNSTDLILSPQGKVFNQEMARKFSKFSQINILCGHYEGFDERIKILSNAEEISVGDFVLTGGELGALIIIDAVSRLKKGVLGKSESFEDDSFCENLLECPQYTKPREYKGLKVPEVLLSGNHAKIKLFRRTEQILSTQKKRPDIFEKFLNSDLSDYDKKILKNLGIVN